MAKEIFPSNGVNPFIERYGDKILVTVLQILVFGSDEFLVEGVKDENLMENNLEV